MPVQVTIIGLGKTGASIGLALQAHKKHIFRTGHEREPGSLQKAHAMGAIDKAQFSLAAAVEKADIVILALPVDQIHETIKLIAPILQPEATLMDTSPIMIGVSKWVQELLPPNRYFVSFHPTLNPKYLHESGTGLEFAHDDLFEKSLVLISATRPGQGQAIKLAADLAGFLRASPYFIDPHEVDGIMAGTEILPRILVSAYLQTITRQPGWKEAQKIAGNTFFKFTEEAISQQEKERFGTAARQNKENTLRLIDQMVDTLLEMRGQMERGEWEEIQRAFQSAIETQIAWKNDRIQANWDSPDDLQETPSAAEMLRKMISFGGKPKK